MVEVVQLFNGEEKRVVGRARTRLGLIKRVRLLRKASSGWGVRVRGTVAALSNVGAYQVDGGDWIFRWLETPTKDVVHEFFVDCTTTT